MSYQSPHLEPVRLCQRESHYDSLYFDRQIATKYLFRLNDGNTIESGVYQHYRGERPIDVAVDVSTMVGCPMDCLFCDAAAIRYVRALAAEEMIAQVDRVNLLHSLESFPVIMCSFQGIGEPSLQPQAILDVGAELLGR